jgi:DNA topoisomerase-2
MEVLSNGTDKIPAQIQDYKEYHTDTTVRFVVQIAQVTSSAISVH